MKKSLSVVLVLLTFGSSELTVLAKKPSSQSLEKRLHKAFSKGCKKIGIKKSTGKKIITGAAVVTACVGAFFAWRYLSPFASEYRVSHDFGQILPIPTELQTIDGYEFVHLKSIEQDIDYHCGMRAPINAAAINKLVVEGKTLTSQAIEETARELLEENKKIIPRYQYDGNGLKPKKGIQIAYDLGVSKAKIQYDTKAMIAQPTRVKPADNDTDLSLCIVGLPWNNTVTHTGTLAIHHPSKKVFFLDSVNPTVTSIPPYIPILKYLATSMLRDVPVDEAERCLSNIRRVYDNNHRFMTAYLFTKIYPVK